MSAIPDRQSTLGWPKLIEKIVSDTTKSTAPAGRRGQDAAASDTRCSQAGHLVSMASPLPFIAQLETWYRASRTATQRGSGADGQARRSTIRAAAALYL